MLQSRLRLRPTLPLASLAELHNDDDDDDAEDQAEDIFTAFLPHLFPDDPPQFHGDPGQCLLYASPRYGDLTIQVPSYPSENASGSNNPQGTESGSSGTSVDSNLCQVDARRTLFAHVLWSAAMVVAEAVEAAHSGHRHADERWKMEREKVLELGAGAALPSVVSVLAGASEVTITDHPSSPALSGAIAFNIKHNIPVTAACSISIRPHAWGAISSDPWAVASKGRFTRIIAADCFWMRSQHENLARTMKWFLAAEGRVWVVAGFHTGRAIVSEFFETAIEMGLEVEMIYERDLNTSFADGDGELRRDWMKVRDSEGPENRMRWCVIALLKHAS